MYYLYLYFILIYFYILHNKYDIVVVTTSITE